MDAAVDFLDGGAAAGLLVPPAAGTVAAAAAPPAHAAVEAVPRHEDHHKDQHQDRHETAEYKFHYKLQILKDVLTLHKGILKPRNLIKTTRAPERYSDARDLAALQGGHAADKVSHLQ